jgi:hypothetical protein
MLDPSTPIGKVRLRVADYSDLPYFGDNVYQQTLDDNDGDILKTSVVMAMYILGTLAHNTHRKMGLQLEIWGAEAFTSYKEFLLLTVKDPAFMQITPVFSICLSTNSTAIAAFQSDWNRSFYCGTEAQGLAFAADIGPNDGSRHGPIGDVL